MPTSPSPSPSHPALAALAIPTTCPIAPLINALSEYPPSNTLTTLPPHHLSAKAATSAVYRSKKLAGTRRSCRCIAEYSCSHASNPAEMKRMVRSGSCVPEPGEEEEEVERKCSARWRRVE